MKVITWREGRGRRYGTDHGDQILGLAGEIGSFIPDGSLYARDVLDRLTSPILPGKIICVGLNYRDHAAESQLDLPEFPALFTKLPSAVIGPGDTIVLPALSSEIDYEAELGVVIGQPTRNVSPKEALGHVFGYTCVNDVSARDLQSREGFGWVRGKSPDTFCPVGPVVVTADTITDPQALAIDCRVNGETVQASNTAEMIFSVAELIAFIASAVTLLPGDLICTGTPSGVGVARRPQRWLSPGDTVEVEISGIGCLRNPVAASEPAVRAR